MLFYLLPTVFLPQNAFQQQITRSPYQPQQQQPLPKREKKLIQIQDPVTLNTVDLFSNENTKARDTPPAGPSEEGSASNTPQPVSVTLIVILGCILYIFKQWRDNY